MKKTLLSILLCFVLVMTMAVMVFAEETEETQPTQTVHTHCVCGGSSEGVHETHACGETTWTPLSEALAEVGLTMETANFGKLPAGNYYLDGDVVATAATAIQSKTISLCLNGHNITTGNMERPFGVMEADGILNICDCSGKVTDGQWTWDGQITGGKANYGGVFWTDDGSEINVYGGNITGLADYQVRRGGIFYITGRLTDGKTYSGVSTVNIYNGKIWGGYASRGGNIEANSKCVINIYGGTITGGRVQFMTGQQNGQGGNIHMSGSSVLNMHGGKITDGVAAYNGYAGHRGSGGNVTFEGVFNMYGGEISGGKCLTDSTAKKTEGSEVYDAYSNQYVGMGGNLALFWAKSEFNMYGGCIYGGEVNALYGGNILVRNASAKVNIKGGHIWGGVVNADGDTGNSGAQVAASDAAGGSIAVTQGTLNIEGGTFGINTAGEAAGGQAGVGGNIYVASGTTATITGGTFANGSASDFGGNFYNQGTLSITGATVKDGIVTNADKRNARGGNISNVASLSITDSTFTGGQAWHGGSIHQNGGTLTMTGTTVSGGHADLDLNGNGLGTGGNIFFAAGTSTVTGCTITEGVAFNGGNLGMQAKATVSNTTISDGTASKSGGNIYFYSNGNLTINEGSTVSNGKAINGGNVCMAHSTAVLSCDSVIFTDGSANTSTGYGGSTYVSSGTATFNKVTVTGGNAQYGGALAVGANGTCTVTGSTISSPTGGYGRAAYVAKGGSLTVQDSTLLNPVATSGTCVWNCGTVYFAGTVNLNTDKHTGSDIMFDNRAGAAPVLDISGLTGQNEPYIFRRWGSTATDTAGHFANGATEEQVAMFNSWSKEHYVSYAEGGLYLNDAVIKGIKANGGSVQGFATFEEAMATDNKDITWFKLLADQSDKTINKSVIIDLNGFDLTNLTLAEGVVLTGIDSATDEYSNDAEYGFVTLSAENKGTVANLVKTGKSDIGSVKRYMAITTDEGISFHRFYMGVTHMSLKPGVTGVGYKAAFYGDDQVLGQVKSYGYNLWLDENDKVQATKDGAFESGKTLKLCLQNFDVEHYGTTAVNAEVFLELQDGTVITSTAYSYTLKDLVESIAKDVSGFTAEQMAALQTMCQNNADAMADWEIDSIVNWSAPEEA